MRARCAASVLLVALGGATALAVTTAQAGDPAPVATTTVVRTVTARVEGLDVHQWRYRAVRNRRGLNRAHRENGRLRRVQHRRWAPTVSYAIALASRVYGVPEAKMRAVAYCESTFNPYATNGRYKGLFQLGWSPFGFSPFDPVASALSAAQTVVHDGSWRQWECG